MNSICLFVHYSTKESLPYYVVIYVNELARFFDELRLITNKRKIDNLSCLNDNISIQFEKNEGYDFGKIYKGLKAIEPTNYKTIAFINDSNVIINKLDAVFEWGKNNQSDFWGIIDSNEKPWFSTNKDNYHIQSHFMVLNENAISLLTEYYNSIDVDAIFNITDLKELRREVIDKWEIGFTQFLINNGVKTSAYIDSCKFRKEHKSKKKNIAHEHYGELLEEGYPLIKKKILFNRTWRRFLGQQESWEKAIHTYLNTEWDREKLLKDVIE